MGFLRSLLAAFLIVGTAFQAFGEIREIKSMREMVPHIEAGAVIIFDLDNTTLRPTQTLGSDQFFRYLRDQAISKGASQADAIALTLEAVTPVQPRSPVVAAEEGTPALIGRLQELGFRVFALTARPEAWALATLRQLASIGVDFSATAPNDVDLYGGVHFQRPGRNKGQDLLEILARLEDRPTKVIFVDDRLSNVESVEAALNTTSIPHESLRYGFLDEWVSAFDSTIADLEWKVFQASRRFMSDEEARACLKRPQGPIAPGCMQLGSPGMQWLPVAIGN